MNWISRLERKYGRFCIPNLISIIVGGQILVYAIELFVNQFISVYLGLSRSLLLMGQVWRLITFVFIPFSVVPQALLQRDMDVKSYALVEIAANTVNVTITIAAAWAGYSSLSLAFGVFGYQASRAIFSQFARPMFRILPPSWEGTGPIFKYGLSSATMSLTSGMSPVSGM